MLNYHLITSYQEHIHTIYNSYSARISIYCYRIWRKCTDKDTQSTTKRNNNKTIEQQITNIHQLIKLKYVSTLGPAYNQFGYNDHQAIASK